MTSFRVGQKVVCIRGAGYLLKEGVIYTVGEIIHEFGETYIWPSKADVDSMGQKGWLVNRFRPLISQSDDVEMFKRIAEDIMGRLDAYEEMLNERFYLDETHE